jgi:hypothetical protein
VQKTTLVIGASENVERYSNMAVKLLSSYQHKVYAIGNKNYYIKLDDTQQPIIRKSKLGKELIVAIPAAASTYSYSITW